ncbi:S1 family peptidase [Paenarthrobacter aromaticivorans]|uniref:Serine protease n=1 Tax=Paenarthrobacter aromaticivorans TaxID=2849150 RepID=A0ABS6IBX9_9MICC|nr:serine protease [Paenarthrobacter sp. MMS21-TAE1-1]MBU8867889.1 serine protease [Paenarthrobacter sp. MMS21-TAE1-1]
MVAFSRPSYQSLLLRLFAKKDNGEDFELYTGTGFLVRGQGSPDSPYYLITNRHILSGRTAAGGHIAKYAATPTEIRITHNMQGPMWQLGDFVEISQPLHDASGLPLWFEHEDGIVVDVAALPITEFDAGHHKNATFFPYERRKPGEPMPELRPSDTVQIVGFPFGQTSYKSLAIWTTGSIASEPSVGYGGYRRFLVDARTRDGQSGSPVIVHTTANHPPLTFTDGSTRSYPGRSYLLGVYSGRISRGRDESDIGIVWKVRIISEIIKVRCRRPVPSETEYRDEIL